MKLIKWTSGRCVSVMNRIEQHNDRDDLQVSQSTDLNDDFFILYF